jgi:hypothetical protein
MIREKLNAAPADFLGAAVDGEIHCLL